ncbi:3-dehydroquinate synthase family protein [Catenuloplanes indicus]|uniref:3-dehydroquinate synthase/2-deoxy-scyllo-inosose synthase n=1 Tax=Catenuloplanes indicus TaxID=137267 RepID=A0AAE4AWE3_9ACTN|nr:iron-containing alcohol dehydrogenase [Catenuloplanes indicus]MDQ0364907.1 3-dehydroquinate synthase/2-deoxy-scyllo-inosose synthase [Catenuloplanes indicus]
MHERLVPLDGKDVPYLYGMDCAGEIADAITTMMDRADSAVLVADRRVAGHADVIAARLRAVLPVTRYDVEAGDRQKRLPLVEEILEHAIARGATRGSVVIGMGGGMVGNVAGLVAALMYRGTRLVHLPTTPVAAFDSVLSVKQAVNLSGGKNLCGTYYAPSLIACDLRWLAGVPDAEMLTGLAEMVKNVLAVLPARQDVLIDALHRLSVDRESALLDLLEIGREAKAPFLRVDPRERREALIFEYGHTTGHALEFVARGAMSHGEAVAWGMLVAAEVSRMLGHLDSRDVERHYQLIRCLRLPDAATRLGGMDPDAVRGILAKDNKRGYLPHVAGQIAMVLLDAPGHVLTGDGGYPLVPVPIDLPLAALDTVIRSVNREPVRGA